MIRQIFEKWFGLTPSSCPTCEVLRDQLDKSEGERRELLHKLLDKDVKPEPSTVQEELKPIQPQFIPWRVKQQMLEQEDRVKAKLMRDKTKEIEDLEKELGVSSGGSK
jgi:hypothetical protein